MRLNGWWKIYLTAWSVMVEKKNYINKRDGYLIWKVEAAHNCFINLCEN